MPVVPPAVASGAGATDDAVGADAEPFACGETVTVAGEETVTVAPGVRVEAAAGAVDGVGVVDEEAGIVVDETEDGAAGEVTTPPLVWANSPTDAMTKHAIVTRIFFMTPPLLRELRRRELRRIVGPRQGTVKWRPGLDGTMPSDGMARVSSRRGSRSVNDQGKSGR